MKQFTFCWEAGARGGRKTIEAMSAREAYYKLRRHVWSATLGQRKITYLHLER